MQTSMCGMSLPACEPDSVAADVRRFRSVAGPNRRTYRQAANCHRVGRNHPLVAMLTLVIVICCLPRITAPQIVRGGSKRTGVHSTAWQSIVDHLPSRNPEAYGLTEAMHLQKHAINPYSLADIADMALAKGGDVRRKSTNVALGDRLQKTLDRRKTKKNLRRMTTFGQKIDPEEELYVHYLKLRRAACTRLLLS